VSPRAIAVAGLSAIVIAASGCSGDSDAEAESPPATTAEQVETQPPAQSAVNITKLRAEFKERFGTPPNEAPWYRHITAINWANGQLEIKTDIRPEEYEGSDRLRGAICGEPLKLAFEQQAEPVDLIAAVTGVGGVGLGYCG
jgi:hypothetical protein